MCAHVCENDWQGLAGAEQQIQSAFRKTQVLHQLFRLDEPDVCCQNGSAGMIAADVPAQSIASIGIRLDAGSNMKNCLVHAVIHAAGAGKRITLVRVYLLNSLQ